MEDLIWIAGIFLGAACIFYLAASILTKKKQLEKRLDQLFTGSPSLRGEVAERKKQSFLQKMVSGIAGAFKGVQFSRKTRMFLLQAGSSLKPEEFLAVKFVSAGAAGAFLWILQLHWTFGMTGLLIGYLLPGIYMKHKRKKRLRLLPTQLIDTLGMMANSMRAGFSFIQVMQLVGKEMPAPIGPEFERAVREAGLGVPMERVFEEMLERLPNKELEVSLQAIIAQRKSGGNLAELLETMEDTIRGRVRILGELNTLTSQGKLSSLVITLLPVGLGLYLYLVDPGYFSPMIEHPLGISMMVLAVLLVMSGWLLIQKILRIEV
jgi:tight adherence protein B